MQTLQTSPITPHSPAVAGDAATPCTAFAVRRLSREISQFYDQRLAAVGLLTTQYSLLAHVRQLPDLPVGALAERMGMRRSTMTRNLRPLLNAGWVETTRGADARSQRVRITDAGLALLITARRIWREAQHELTARLGVEDATLLHRIAERAYLRLSTSAGNPSHAINPLDA